MRNVHSMAMERAIPITRSSRSFFDPSWEVGTWHDFGSVYKRMEEHMRQMNREIEEMFRRFERLIPLDHARSLQALPPPMSMPQMAPIAAPPAITAGPPALGPPARIQPPMQMPEMPPMKPMTMADDWRMENPITTDKDGSRKVKLQFDVRQFKPEEITVRTQDNQLTVHARHEENGPNGRVFREYNRQFLLPESVHLETLSSILSPEGVLSVTAPMRGKGMIEPSREKIIPIEYKPRN